MTDDVDPIEDRTRRSLVSLDGLAVPALGAIQVRTPRRQRFGAVGALASALVVVTAALLVGDALSAWRTDRAAASAGPTAVAPAGVTMKPDPRYGVLVRRPDKTLALVDELGKVLLTMPDSIDQAKTSPNGRYIALWTRTGAGAELRILDGVTRTIGAPLFTTAERFARQNEGLVWASDSSAVLVATTADDTAGSGSPLDVNLRAVTLNGDVRRVATYHTWVFAPLAWDRSANVISAVSFERFQPTAGTKLLRFKDDGSGNVDSQVASDSPMAADDAGRFVISSVSCPGVPTCRKFAVHDVATYGAVAQIELPPLLVDSGYWGVRFLPRSSDILTDFSRNVSAGSGRFGLEVYGDAGRAARRDLGDTVITSIKSQIVFPNAFPRADGSAVLYVHTKNDGTGDWDGEIVDVASAAHGPIAMQQPVATILLDPALVPAAAATIDDPTNCPTGTSPYLDVTRFPNAPDLHGAPTPEDALRAAYPTTASITKHPFGASESSPVWLIADNRTYLASVLPDGTWFVSTARLIACRALVAAEALDVVGYHFVVTLVDDPRYAPNATAGAAWTSAIPGLGVRCQWSRSGPTLTRAEDLFGPPAAVAPTGTAYAPVNSYRGDVAHGIPSSALQDRTVTMVCGVADDTGRHGVLIELTVTADGAHVSSRFVLRAWPE